ncbi:hypothetical protein LCGC14_1587120 [marine sediment metagenome]|uniref:Protein kinase domain-containing protein n=1 Tax=marine sediment metagenome TaxID=412755 RepID=A0A0F9LFI5_9ZZZZ|nr:hypothetical protein [bacterium]
MSLQAIKNKVRKDLRRLIPEFGDNKENFHIIKLKSRKNFVYDVSFDNKPQNLPKEFVIKVFNTKNIVSENNILTRLKNQNFHVPKIFVLKKPYLILEKIKGDNLCDFINDNLNDTKQLNELSSKLKNQIIHYIEKLAEWLALLHEKNIARKYGSEENFVLNKGDTRLRDFIINTEDDILFGVDFEDAYEGNNLDDLAWICCSLLDTDPGIFEMTEPKHKMELINHFLKHYYKTNSSFQFDFNYLAEKIIEHLNIVISRRNLPYGQFNKTTFLQDIKI